MRGLLPLLILTLAPGFATAFDQEGWTWKASIQTPEAESEFLRLPLDLWVFDASLNDLRDLRIIDASENLVPHALHWGSARTATREKWLRNTLVNHVYQPNQYARVTVDHRGRNAKNRLRVRASGENFRRRVLIEGSDDRSSWDVVAENLFLFDITQSGSRYRLDTLSFPSNDFRYLRLTVFCADDDPRRINIHSVETAFSLESPEELLAHPAQSVLVEQDAEKQETRLMIDTGFRNLPVTKIELAATNPYFYRAYVLEGRNAATVRVKRRTETGWDEQERDAPWNTLRQGVLYRVRKANGAAVEDLKIDRARASYRHLRLRIMNGDNPPLKISRDDLQLFRREVHVLFDAHKGGAYSLLGGNAKADAPRYDLARSVANLAKQNLLSASLGTRADFAPVEKLAPWSERHQALLWIVTALAVAVVATLFISNLRSLKNIEPE